jgi:hypothetical protein
MRLVLELPWLCFLSRVPPAAPILYEIRIECTRFALLSLARSYVGFATTVRVVRVTFVTPEEEAVA